MKLTAGVVLELAQLRAEIAAKKRTEEQLCNDIKDRMIEKGIDVFAPPSLPMTLMKTEYDQVREGFHEYLAEKAYKELYGTNWMKAIEREKENYPKKHIIRLNVMAGNQNFQLKKAG